MSTIVRQLSWSAVAGSLLLAVCASAPSRAQEGYDNYGSRDPAPANDSYSRSYESNSGDSYSGSGNSGYGNSGYGSGRQKDAYAPRNDSYAAPRNDSYSRGRANDAYSPGGDSYSGSSGGRPNDAYSPGGNAYARQPDPYASGDAYSPTRARQNHSYTDPGRPSDPGGYGEPYAAAPGDGGPPPGYADGGPMPPAGGDRTYNQNEIVTAGHSFFGAISQGLAQAVEYTFKSQGRPNGYILGEDAGGAFVVGLRYGEGRLFTKDAGEHKVFWQGPSVGYDAGAEGSKTMVLVYNMRDPSEIYERFGGVEGSAYLVGGVSVQFQKYNDVTLAVIRSGVGLRLGANVGYLKYTRAPTWNPL